MRRSALLGLSAAVAAGVLCGPAVAHVQRPAAYAISVLPALGGEPGIAVSPNGRNVMVSGASAAPAGLFLSTDGGTRYLRLHPAFTFAGGADFDMTWLDDSTILAADLSLNGQGVLVHRSTDRGATWTTTMIDNDLYDRPWIAHYGNTVYVVTRGFDQLPYVYTSADGGRTFGVPALLYGSDPAALGPNPPIVLQNIAVAPDGTLYVLIQDATSQLVARMVPGAIPTFVTRPVAEAETENGFSWLTVDDAGTVYVASHQLRSGQLGAWLYVSKDRGSTWSKGVNLTEQTDGSAFAAVRGGRPGELSLVYLAGQKNNSAVAQSWWAEVARVTHADTARPVVAAVRPVANPMHVADICSMGVLCTPPHSRSLLDYVSTDITKDGRVFAVVASDGPATGDRSGMTNPLTGLVFRSAPR